MTSDLIANDDPVKAERARSLLRSAAKAVDAFEEAIRELVAMRAWFVLGYADLGEMWEAENGFKCPNYAASLAVEAMADEGMGLRRGGHSTGGIAKAVGLPVAPNGKESSTVSGMLRQLRQGVPAKRVVKSDGYAARNVINKYGSRARPSPRRVGKTADELVHEGFAIRRGDADAIGEIARKADVPKAEIYRQAVAEYLQRQGVSTHFGTAPNVADQTGEA